MGKGNFELYKGDCRELLSKVDVSNVKLLLTDPPYGIGYNAVKNNLPTFNDYGDIQGDEGMDLSFLFELKMEQIVFGANCFPQYLPHRGRWICWDKRTNESADKATRVRNLRVNSDNLLIYKFYNKNNQVIMTQTIATLPMADTATVKLAINKMKEYAQAKGYEFSGNVEELGDKPLSFPSMNQEKKVRWALLRVINRPSMRSINYLLNQLSKATGTAKLKIDYSATEKKIKAARKEWKELQAKADELRLKYKELKGDFYKK